MGHVSVHGASGCRESIRAPMVKRSCGLSSGCSDDSHSCSRTVIPPPVMLCQCQPPRLVTCTSTDYCAVCVSPPHPLTHPPHPDGWVCGKCGRFYLTQPAALTAYLWRIFRCPVEYGSFISTPLFSKSRITADSFWRDSPLGNSGDSCRTL